MIVAYRDGSPVRLRDIAEVEDGLSDFRQLARFNGRTAVGLGIVKIPNTNTVAIIDRVQQRLENEIVPALPPGMKIDLVHERLGVHPRDHQLAEGAPGRGHAARRRWWCWCSCAACARP